MLLSDDEDGGKGGSGCCCCCGGGGCCVTSFPITMLVSDDRNIDIVGLGEDDLDELTLRLVAVVPLRRLVLVVPAAAGDNAVNLPSECTLGIGSNRAGLERLTSACR